MQHIQKIRFFFSLLLTSVGILSADPMLWNPQVVPYNGAVPYQEGYYPQQSYGWSPYASTSYPQQYYGQPSPYVANTQHLYPQQAYAWEIPCYGDIEASPRDYSFFVRGDVLYWKPHVSRVELDFGNSAINSTMAGDTQIIFTDEFNAGPHFQWNAGCRIGAGMELSNFELGIVWTHFQDKASSHKRHFHRGKYHLNFNQVDLLFGYAAKMNSSFNLKPFCGVRFANIQDHIKTHLNTDIVLSPTSTALQQRIFHDKQNMWSVGPVAGINCDYMLADGFGLYGTAAAGLLYGDYKIHFNDVDLVSAPLSKQIYSINKSHLHEFNWNIDLALGICWSTWISNLFEIRMKLGFEHHQYFDHGHLSINPGDLTFDGGIYSLEISF